MVRIFLAKIEGKITSESFIKYIVNNYLNIQQDNLIIEKNKYGKPFLSDFPNDHYNISHTKGLIVCAISGYCVGIDIEKIKNFNKRIPKRFFTKNEQDYIFCREEDQNKRFFDVWTRKEAYVKWVGKGLDISLGSFDVIDEARITTAYIDDYVISICTIIENPFSCVWDTGIFILDEVLQYTGSSKCKKVKLDLNNTKTTLN